jgi:hypothetical protein
MESEYLVRITKHDGSTDEQLEPNEGLARELFDSAKTTLGVARVDLFVTGNPDAVDTWDAGDDDDDDDDADRVPYKSDNPKRRKN